MSEKRSWYASSRERTPGNLLKYTLVVIAAVVFAGVAIFNLLMTARVGSLDIWGSLLWGVIYGAGAAVVGVIIWFIYTRLAVKK
jgi:hypothetical protein